VALDLSGIQSFVEDNLMDDDCIITRDASGVHDDAFDPETGEYVRPDGDDGIVYEGDCWVSRGGNQPMDQSVGGTTQIEEAYYLNIPLGAAEVKDGDYIVIRASLRMQQLVGKTFRANIIEMGTFKIKQKVRMVRYTPQALR
jgi:hypothetical protein